MLLDYVAIVPPFLPLAAIAIIIKMLAIISNIHIALSLTCGRGSAGCAAGTPEAASAWPWRKATKRADASRGMAPSRADRRDERLHGFSRVESRSSSTSHSSRS